MCVLFLSVSPLFRIARKRPTGLNYITQLSQFLLPGELMIGSGRVKKKNFKGAVFVDLDGTVWPDLGPGTIFKRPHVNSQLALCLSEIANSGYALIAFTNQTYFGYRSKLNLFDVIVYRYLLRKLVTMKILDGVFVCHHHPKSEIAFLRRNCSCRKPRSGLLKWAKREFELDFDKSFAVGDRITDMLAAFSAGISRSFLIVGPECLKWNDTDLSSRGITVNFEVTQSLEEALSIIQEDICYVD